MAAGGRSVEADAARANAAVICPSLPLTAAGTERTGGRGLPQRAFARTSPYANHRRGLEKCRKLRHNGSFKRGRGCGITYCGTALVVDDHANFRELIARQLESAGIRAIEAANGEEALERAPEADVVLLDVNLPEMSGYTICRELREAYGEALPIVFLSGYRTESLDRAAGLLIGGDDYVVKPPEIDEFLARVRRLIDRSQRRSAPADNGYGLTRRELDVLRLLGGGQRASEIAVELGISPKTVSSHVQHILAKLGVHSRAQAVARAYETGLVA
jgi:DNA-binding NarL/FixJ family response regulator